MKTKTKRKMRGLTAIAMALAMVLSLFGGITFAPVTAYAAFAGYESWEQLIADNEAVAISGTTYKLLKDIQTRDTLTITSTSEVTLDLNGYGIMYTNSSRASVITVEKNANLTIIDNRVNSTHYITLTEGRGTNVADNGTPSETCIEVTGGYITGGRSINYGGGVYNNGTFIMNGGTISGNITAGDGGGVFSHGTFKMSGGTINNNTASGRRGGGVYNDVVSTTEVESGKTVTLEVAPNSGYQMKDLTVTKPVELTGEPKTDMVSTGIYTYQNQVFYLDGITTGKRYIIKNPSFGVYDSTGTTGYVTAQYGDGFNNSNKDSGIYFYTKDGVTSTFAILDSLPVSALRCFPDF